MGQYLAREPQWEFDWDTSNLRHLAQHGISRPEFEPAMTNNPVFMDVNDESGEERWYALGATDSLRVLFLVFTYRGERVRPITGWDAGRPLREAYFHRKKV
jgi:hypothetical protein